MRRFSFPSFSCRRETRRGHESTGTWALVTLPPLAVAFAAAWIVMPGQPVWAGYAVVLIIAYLLGSMPWGYLMLQWRRGVDIREYGSGRTGMSNVLRTGGGKVAAVVLALDVSKGILSVFLAGEVIGHREAEVAAGLMALVGHNWPVYLGFRGGRGIATGAGALSVLSPIAAAVAVSAFAATTLVSRYVSLGSIVGVIAACVSLVALYLLGQTFSIYTLYGFLGGAIIIWQHRDNIQRIRDGSERRLGAPATKAN